MPIELTNLTRSRRFATVEIVVGDGEEKRSEKCSFSFLTITPQKYDELVKAEQEEGAVGRNVTIAKQMVALDLRSDDIVDADGHPAVLTFEILSCWDLFNLLVLQDAILGETFPKNVLSLRPSESG